MVQKFDTRPIRLDVTGHRIGGGQNVPTDVGVAQVQTENRAASFAVTGRLSSAGGNARISEFLAVPAFVDVDVATGTIGSTKATLDASLALVNDALAAIFTDANAIAAAVGVEQVTYAGGGTAASPIAAITGAGTALVTSADAATMNPIRDQINTNMHTAGALVNKVMRALRLPPVDIETNPMRQPPPDDYGAGSTGGFGTGQTSAAGSGLAFGAESPFTDPTPAITEDSGTHVGTAVTGAALDAALDTWRDNVETLAKRLAVATNTVVALTDSTTGTAVKVVGVITPLPADATIGGAGPTKATLDAELADTQNSIASLFSKANELAAGLGVKVRTYDGGGTVSDTLAAVGNSGIAAATGPTKATMDGIILQWETAWDSLAELVNELAFAVDVVPLGRSVTGVVKFDNPVNPQQNQSQSFSFGVTDRRFRTQQLDPTPGSTIVVDSGTAGDPGQLKADLDTMLSQQANNLATFAAKINEVRTALAAPLVKLV